MERPKTTKNVGQPCVICGQSADAQATVEALQAAANYYKQPSKNGGVYSVSGGHIGNLMDWCKDNLAHCKFSGPDEDNLDLDLVQTAQQIPQLKTELSQLQALVRKFVDSIQPVDCVEVDELLREARATLDATTPASERRSQVKDKVEKQFQALATKLIMDAEAVPCSIRDFYDGLRLISEEVNERIGCEKYDSKGGDGE